MSDTAQISLNNIAEFIWREADLLDSKSYVEWLPLWAEHGKYVVPIDPEETDFENSLNFAYDNAAMRDMRVRRLTSGQSMSASHAARTLRTVSRFVRVEDDRAGAVCVRAAQNLVEFKFERHKIYAANVTWKLQPHGDSFLITEKVVRLINSEGALAGMTILL